MLAALALPAVAHADLRVALSQRESADPVKPGDLETYTVSVRNVGSDTLFSDFTVELAGFAPDSSRAVNNPYRSVTPSQGSCVITNTDAANRNEYGLQVDGLHARCAGARRDRDDQGRGRDERVDGPLAVDVLGTAVPEYNFPVFETT